MNRLMANAKKPRCSSVALSFLTRLALLSRLAPWDSSGLYNVVTSSSGSLGVQKRFGVDSPSLKIELVVIGVAVVVIADVIVVAVVVESLVGLAKVRYYQS
ncbi:hypothetical protein Tco_1503482 [Tanacetum coccineum]